MARKKHEDDIEVYLGAPGDPSVGIWPAEATLILHGMRQFLKEDKEERENTRLFLKEAFGEFWDMGPVGVIFDDEKRGK